MAKAKKSAPVKLTPEKLQELKDAITSGESPKSIHERLGVSIYNIHYHKGELKKKGLLTEGTVAVKKPAPVKKSAVAKSVRAPKKAKAVKATGVSSPAPVSKTKSFKLIVNGISVSVDGAASVSVGEGFIKVDY